MLRCSARVEGRSLAVVSVVFLALTATTRTQPAPSERQRVGGAAADRVIDGAFVVHRRAITPDVLLSIARHARIPLGLETLPGSAPAPEVPVERQKRLTGLTVREALNWLVEMDPRYRWEEMSEKRVVVIRPVAAWDDAQHVLHEFVDECAGTSDDDGHGVVDLADHPRARWHRDLDAMDVMRALGTFYEFGTFALPRIPEWPWAPVTFSVGPVSGLDVLNEIARSGGLCWHISYNSPFVPRSATCESPRDSLSGDDEAGAVVR